MKKRLLKTLSVVCLLFCFTGIGLAMQNNVKADATPTVTLQDGAAVRLSTVNAGIRFTAVIDNYSESYDYGMYIFPAEFLDDYTTGDVIAHAESKLAAGKSLAGGDCTTYFSGGKYKINGALVNLHYANLNREFVAVAYVRNGNDYTYSDVSVKRNIVWCSGAAIAGGEYEGYETELGILNNFVKLGSYQAIGVDEETAKAATELPAISVSGSTEVYKGLWTTPTPTFTCNEVDITANFKPYASETTEGLIYSQKMVKSYVSGAYSLSYANVEGTYDVTVREYDATPDSAYFGNYDTVEKVSTAVVGDNRLDVADAQDAEVSVAIGDWNKTLEAGRHYSVTDAGISVFGSALGYMPTDLYILNDDAATVYRTVYIDDYFSTAEKVTTVFKYITSSGLGRGYENNKTYISLKSDGNITGRYYATGFDIEYLELAYAAGYYCLEFDVSVDAAFAAFANKGIRVYASTQTTGFDGGAIQNGTSGVNVYRDFGTDVTSATKFTVKVVLSDFLALNASANQLRFTIGAPKDNQVYFSNFRVREKSSQDIAEDYVSKYGFNSANSGAGGKWSVVSGGVMTRVYDSEHDGMKITMTNASAAINGRYYVLYTPIEMLTEAQTLGFNKVSFKVSSDNGAFTSAGRGIRVYSKANSGADGGAIANGTAGVYVYGDYGTDASTTEFTITINTYEFISLNPSAGYIGFVMNIPNATNAYFSDLSVSRSTTEELVAKYGFNEANSGASGKWTAASAGITARVWDSTNNAMKVQTQGYNAPSRFPVIYTPIEMVEEAQAAGFSHISFTVSSNDGAFTDEGKGIRVFSKRDEGAGSYNIQTFSTAGIYVYNDYGMEADTTDFTVVIDINDFLTKSAAYTPNYLAIAIYAPTNTTAYFKDMTFGWQTTFGTIAISGEASDAEINAANQLKTYLETAMGTTVRIKTEGQVSGSDIIYIGRTDAFDALSVADFDEEHLNGDGFVITGNDDALYIAGATDKGTLNGVYYFLEEYVGVEFYSLDYTYVPSVDSIFYTTDEIREIPSFKYRGVLTDSTMHVNAAQGRTADKVAEFYAETRQSHEFLQDAVQTVVDNEFGGSVNMFKGINQTHNNLTYVNPTTYLSTYPSMFYVVDEKAVDICYSSGINANGTIASGTNAASVYVASLKNYITANPDMEYFVLGQEDVRTHCTCSTCNDGTTDYGYGKYSGVVLRFYNAVAKAIYAWETANGRDHVKIVIFSYLFSAEAPVQKVGNVYQCHATVALASNIVLRFSDISANVYIPFTDSNQSSPYGADYLVKWAPVIGENEVWYWGHGTAHSYYFAYTPSLQKISALLDALDDVNTEYVFIQHSTSENNDWRAKMESYVISKLLWDSTANISDLRDEYINGYYGVAGAKVKEFVDNFDSLMASIAATDVRYFATDIMNTSIWNDYVVSSLVSKSFLNNQLAVLDDAVAAINASELSSEEKNILIARVNAVKVTPLFYLAYAAGSYYNNSSDRDTARTTFISLCESLGITAYGEHKYISQLKSEWGIA